MEPARGQSSLAQQSSSSRGSGTALASAMSQQLPPWILSPFQEQNRRLSPREPQCLLIKTLILEFVFKQVKLDQVVNVEHCGVFASNTIGRKKKTLSRKMGN